MWTEGNYRRLFLDMHIADDKEEYLSKLDTDKIFRTLKEAGAQMICVKGRTHTGLANFPTKFGRQHRGLKGRDYVGEMVKLCHDNGIAVMGYFSQIFDNWAYENHPDWRMINREGKSSREYEEYYNLSMFRRGRYGLVCPNNPDYREYVRNCLTEMCGRYHFETIFMDMCFWPEVCFCPSCRERYFRETGREMPEKVDWDDPDFLEFADLRNRWMAEFTEFTGGCVKAVDPDCTIQQNVGGAASGLWVGGITDWIADQCEYVGGDLYGGYFEESFICKYSRNLSNSLPFCYDTSRCDPDLNWHTSTRAKEEFILHGIIPLVHNGAFEICDGINPDGTLCEGAYQVISEVFRTLEPYPQYVNGMYDSVADVWLPSHSKFDRRESGLPIGDARVWANTEFMAAKVGFARVLHNGHIPYNVIPSKCLPKLKGKLLVATSIAHIRDEEMEAIEAYLNRGGCVYLSGKPGHPRLLELMEAEYVGDTQEDATYLTPTEAGSRYFVGFDRKNPLALTSPQALLRFHGEHETLATLTLPYTMTCRKEFSSIHSNPPGRHTDYEAMVSKRVGNGRIIWVGAPIEVARPVASRMVIERLAREICGELPYVVEAPSCVEVMSWEKDGKRYFSAVNELEIVPPVPMDGIRIHVPYKVSKATLLSGDGAIGIEETERGCTLVLPRLELFHILEVEVS